jgi:hypothetical protein
MTARSIMNLGKLAEAQEAAEAAMAAAMLAAEKVAEAVRVMTDPARLTDRRVTVTLRIEPELLKELKRAAVDDRRNVNDLILEGVAYVLAKYGAGEVS